MRVTANGRAYDVVPGTTVAAFIEERALDPRYVVVERNGEALERAQYATVTLGEGDRLELVRAVAGGSGPPHGFDPASEETTLSIETASPGSLGEWRRRRLAAARVYVVTDARAARDDLDAPRECARPGLVREMVVQHGSECLRARRWLDVAPMSESDRTRHPRTREGDAAQPGSSLGDHAGHDRNAQAGFDEGEDRVELASLDGDLRLDVLAPQRGEHQVAHVVSIAQHDQRVASEVANAKCLGSGDGPVGGRRDDQWLLEERGRDERGVAGMQGKDDERKIELAVGEQLHQFSAAALLDEDVDAGIGGTEASERGRQQHGRQRRRGAKAEPASSEPDEFVYLNAGALDVGKDPGRQGEQRVACGSECDVAPRPVEQRCSELAFE